MRLIAKEEAEALVEKLGLSGMAYDLSELKTALVGNQKLGSKGLIPELDKRMSRAEKALIALAALTLGTFVGMKADVIASLIAKLIATCWLWIR